MNKSLKFVRHLIRAKGRHGTHSPFVYAFVEQVLRGKARLPVVNEGYPAPAGRQKTALYLSAKQLKLLRYTLHFLKPERVVLLEGNTLPVSPALKRYPEKIGIISIAAIAQQSIEATLVIADVQEALLLVQLPAFVNTPQIKILVVKPHQNQENERKWERLCALTVFNMTLDYWHFGLLIANPSFKAKQHFPLR